MRRAILVVALAVAAIGLSLDAAQLTRVRQGRMFSQPLVEGESVPPIAHYVSTSGNDSNSCDASLSSSTPKRNFNGAQGALACLSAGETLLVRGGTYVEVIDNVVMAGTSWANTIRIAAYPGETVWLKPTVAASQYILHFINGQTYLDFDGINLDASNGTTGSPMGGLLLRSGGSENADHIRFQNAELILNRPVCDVDTCPVGIVFAGLPTDSGDNEITNVTIHGSGGDNTVYGMYIHTSNNTVDRCHIYDVSYEGLQIYSGAGLSSGNIVKNCRIHDIVQSHYSGRSGIVTSGNNHVIVNNLIYNINSDNAGVGSGIFVYDGVGQFILNNTIANSNLNEAIAVGSVFRNPTNTLIENNIAYGNTGSNDVVHGPSSTSTRVTNLFGVNPNFLNPGANDFRLQASSTAAINTGTATAYTFDILGVTRPQGKLFDIGAYEF